MEYAAQRSARVKARSDFTDLRETLFFREHVCAQCANALKPQKRPGSLSNKSDPQIGSVCLSLYGVCSVGASNAVRHCTSGVALESGVEARVLIGRALVLYLEHSGEAVGRRKAHDRADGVDRTE